LRRVLGIRVAELAAKLGVVESVVFAHELSEVNNTIQINTLSGVAEAMGCKVIYGIVPIHGQTLEELASEIYVQRVLEARERSAANTEQLTAVGSDGTDISPGTGVQEEVARDQGCKAILYLPLPR
jgi:D-ribose pyranose/furanose isomerase RbsD